MLERLKSLQLPDFGKTVDVPVYLIHTGPEAETYFFIFDFEEFVEKGQSGLFVRPRLLVWSGRRDFSRPRFARQFRAAFAEQFDAARAALDAQGTVSKGWFGWLRAQFGSGIKDFAANLLLALALNAGRGLLGHIGKAHLLSGKSDTAKLEEAIAGTQGKVDAALTEMEIRLHPDLYTHAWQGQAPGPMSGIDRNAWPLPGSVAQHLEAP